jgi:hypothetical protein
VAVQVNRGQDLVPASAGSDGKYRHKDQVKKRFFHIDKDTFFKIDIALSGIVFAALRNH